MGKVAEINSVHDNEAVRLNRDVLDLAGSQTWLNTDKILIQQADDL